MNLGLRDAVTLGDALSVALREGREDHVGAYAAGSSTEAVHVVALAHRLTRLATAPRAVRPLRNVWRCASSHSYLHSAAAWPSSSPAIGHR